MTPETINGIIQIVNGVGFPIVACAGMGWFIVWDRKQRAKEIEDTRAANKDMNEAFTTSIDNNTKTMQEFVAEFRKIKGE